MRIVFCFLFSLLALPSLAAPATPANDKAKSSPPPPPANLDVVTFLVHFESEPQKLIVTSAPTVTRVDKPAEEYSVIYNAQTDSYLGLEHSNYTYWQFSWPEVRAAVESSKRYESRLQELNLAGINSLTAKAPGEAAAGSVPDTSGYVWSQTNDKKTIAGLNCTLWKGQTVSGDTLLAWCFDGPLPKIQTAIDRLKVMNEPLALTAIRTLVPPLVFPVFSALTKAGVTPVQITWGERNKNSFTFVEAKARDPKLSLFTVPNLYMKTTLVSMDGIIDQKK